eukprot:Sdes_comp19709_c0_seq2m11642
MLSVLFSASPDQAVYEVLKEVCKRKTLDIDCHRFWNTTSDTQIELDKKISELCISEVFCRPVDGKRLQKQAANNQKDLEYLESILSKHQSHLDILLSQSLSAPSSEKESFEKQITHFRKLVSIMDNERRRLKSVLSYAVLCAKPLQTNEADISDPS